MKTRAALAALALLSAPALRVDAGVADRIVGRVNRDVITMTEWDDAVQAVLAGRKTQPTPEERKKVADQVLDRLISERLIVQAAADEGLKVTDSEVAPKVDEEIEALRARFASPREFDAQMRREGVSLEDLRFRIGSRLKDQYMYFKELGRKQRELEAGVDVTDEEVREYYDANSKKPEWQTAPQVHARAIVFGVDPELKGEARKVALDAASKKVAAARAALSRGEKFEEVARTLSEDAATRENGGDLGTFARGTYNEALEKIAFGLKAGQVSKPVDTPEGIYLVKVEEVLPPRLRGLNDTIKVAAPVAGEGGGAPEMQEMTLGKYIRAIVRNQKLSAAMQNWVDGLKARALIQKTPEAAAQP